MVDLKVKEDATKPTPFSVGCTVTVIVGKYKCDQTKCTNPEPYSPWSPNTSYTEGECVQVKPGSNIPSGTYMCEEVIWCKNNSPGPSSVQAGWWKLFSTKT